MEVLVICVLYACVGIRISMVWLLIAWVSWRSLHVMVEKGNGAAWLTRTVQKSGSACCCILL